MGASTVAGKAVRHLHELNDALTQAGYQSKIEKPFSGPPFVHVTSPTARQLSEEIRCNRRRPDDDALVFYWSWGEPICSADDIVRAVDRIANVVGDHR